MFQGLSDFGHAFLGFMDPMTLAYGLGGAFVGIGHRPCETRICRRTRSERFIHKSFEAGVKGK